MDERIFSSSLSGYLVISPLIDSTCSFVIGFPENEWPDMQVTVQVKEPGTGFLLKKTGDRDWVMVDLQTRELVTILTASSSVAKPAVKTTGDEFARILAEVVNDPSIADPNASIKATDTGVPSTEKNTGGIPGVKGEVKSGPDKPNRKEMDAGDRGISKLQQDSTAAGLLITYLDVARSGADTVKVLIPESKADTLRAKEDHPEQVIGDTKKATEAANDSRFINMELQNPNDKTDSGAVKKYDLVITEKKAVARDPSNEKKDNTMRGEMTDQEIKSAGCITTATENDFLRLRKQMAAEFSEKNMIRAADKAFMNTCFSTEQVKNLGVLFITDEGKYKFYVAAYPFVSDMKNFGTLEDQLTDNYYKTRFKTMLSH